MIMKERILQVFNQVFGETAIDVFFNGWRAEGLSVLITNSVWSYQIEELVQALNQALPELEYPLDEWRVRKATANAIVNKEVPEEDKDDCYEVRLIYKGTYHH